MVWGHTHTHTHNTGVGLVGSAREIFSYDLSGWLVGRFSLAPLTRIALMAHALDRVHTCRLRLLQPIAAPPLPTVPLHPSLCRGPARLSQPPPSRFQRAGCVLRLHTFHRQLALQAHSLARQGAGPHRCLQQVFTTGAGIHNNGKGTGGKHSRRLSATCSNL